MNVGDPQAGEKTKLIVFYRFPTTLSPAAGKLTSCRLTADYGISSVHSHAACALPCCSESTIYVQMADNRKRHREEREAARQAAAKKREEDRARLAKQREEARATRVLSTDSVQGTMRLELISRV